MDQQFQLIQSIAGQNQQAFQELYTQFCGKVYNTLAPFDDAGGHINPAVGYHYHAATGKSTEIRQADDHAPMIGYAMDGHGLYALLDENGKEPVGLDECRGHYDETRGYHYHVDAAGKNNFINCLQGAVAE